jgi:hypothetical protein
MENGWVWMIHPSEPAQARAQGESIQAERVLAQMFRHRRFREILPGSEWQKLHPVGDDEAIRFVI